MTRIKLLTVGATLTSQGKDPLDLARYGREYSGLPALAPADLLANIPEMSHFAKVEPGRDWGNLDPRPKPTVQWLELASELQAMFDCDATLGGAVLVHGTNSLEETAFFLHLLLKTSKPLVVVGAQRPFTALSSDGALNMVNAVRVAASPDASGRGVLVVLNTEIHSARDVSKTNTYRLETFKSPDLGPLGFADADRVVFYRVPERAHTLATPFKVSGLRSLPRVEILYDYYGQDGGLVKAAVDLGAEGIVVAGSGAGSTGYMRDSLKQAMEQGVVVVRSSRLGSGRVLPGDNYSFPGSVAADNLNPQKARVLLQLCLTLTNDPTEVQRLFDTC